VLIYVTALKFLIVTLLLSIRFDIFYRRIGSAINFAILVF